jgi:hypothetical protein
MPENYICKDCNYANDAAGLCPYCDMPLEPLDPTKIDPNTGTPKDTYTSDDIKSTGSENDLPPLPREDDEEDDIDEIEEELPEEEPIDDEE